MPPDRPLTQLEIVALERLFRATLPFCVGGQPIGMLISHHKNFRNIAAFCRLEERGFAEWVERRLGERFQMLIRGWSITLPGHMAYCEWTAKHRPKESEDD